VQFDEKWDFVGKKERHCEPQEATAGDCWDHVALDPESRLVVSLVVGKRTAEATHRLVADFHRRTGGRIPWLMTSDEYPVYADAIRRTYGQGARPHGPADRGDRGRGRWCCRPA
jgi:IS1 family transposase